MHLWSGWTSPTAAAANAAPTWDEWRTAQQRLLDGAQRRDSTQRVSHPFSARELARLSFLRWLHHTGRLTPAHNDTD
jgi:hypothetical protein